MSARVVGKEPFKHKLASCASEGRWRQVGALAKFTLMRGMTVTAISLSLSFSQQGSLKADAMLKRIPEISFSDLLAHASCPSSNNTHAREKRSASIHTISLSKFMNIIHEILSWRDAFRIAKTQSYLCTYLRSMKNSRCYRKISTRKN